MSETAKTGWAEETSQIFLAAGINRFRVNFAAPDSPATLDVHSLEIAPTADSVQTMEAEASANTFGGTTHVISLGDMSARQAVTGIGAGPENFRAFATFILLTVGQLI